MSRLTFLLATIKPQVRGIGKKALVQDRYTYENRVGVPLWDTGAEPLGNGNGGVRHGLIHADPRCKQHLGYPFDVGVGLSAFLVSLGNTVRLTSKRTSNTLTAQAKASEEIYSAETGGDSKTGRLARRSVGFLQ